ncbi:MAG TPA: VOC family protein [Solirubrobacteraceae bacterium]|nr:VOC family protein [Solirubrobacteraceae bacterium]
MDHGQGHRETLAEAERAGAGAREGPTRDGPRWLASVLDPAGNLVGLAQHAGVPADRGNRTMPPATIMPVLVYDDVPGAIDWLRSAFGFTERWRVDAHRAVLEFGGGAVMLGDHDPAGAHDHGASAGVPTGGDSIMVRVADVDLHCSRARGAGARVTAEPRDSPYGERQYSVLDIGGHEWTFSQSVADRAPEEWGGTSGAALQP